MEQNAVPYAYGRPIWVPYAYGPIYAYGAEQLYCLSNIWNGVSQK